MPESFPAFFIRLFKVKLNLMHNSPLGDGGSTPIQSP